MSIEQKITFPNDADDSKTTIIKPGETFRQRNIRVISGFEDQTDGASYYVDFEISCHLNGEIGIIEVINPLTGEVLEEVIEVLDNPFYEISDDSGRKEGTIEWRHITYDPSGNIIYQQKEA